VSRRGAGLLAAGLAVLLAAAAPAGSTIYSYTDENGVTHFTNVPNDPRFKKVPGSSPPPPPRAARPVDGKFGEHIARASESHGVDSALVKAVIKAESDFDPAAVSRCGAQGLMQLMPGTARERNVANPFNPAENIDGGVRHLKYLLTTFGDTSLALAAYNAGENAVRKYNGIPPYPETRNYVTQVLHNYGQYAAAGPAAAAAPPEPAIQTFVNREGTVVFTNVPWKYLESSGWRRGHEE
jgi:soluble lytic murein transglycosylase